MTLQEIQHKAQSIISKWRDDDSAPYIELVEELAHMIVPEPSDDLEEASRRYQEDVPVDTTIHYCGADEDVYFANRIIESFIAGAVNEREKIMKEAVGVQVVGEQRDLRLIDSTQRCLFNANRGDWLKIIIVNEDK